MDKRQAADLFLEPECWGFSSSLKVISSQVSLYHNQLKSPQTAFALGARNVDSIGSHSVSFSGKLHRSKGAMWTWTRNPSNDWQYTLQRCVNPPSGWSLCYTSLEEHRAWFSKCWSVVVSFEWSPKTVYGMLPILISWIISIFMFTLIFILHII